MGTWGVQPWENDAASDWFHDLFRRTQLAQVVQQALESDIDQEPEQIRAAAFLLGALAHVHVWPLDTFDHALRLAIVKLESLLARVEGQDDSEGRAEWVKALRVELQTLRDRLDESDRE